MTTIVANAAQESLFHLNMAERWYRSYLQSQQRCENEEVAAKRKFGDLADVDLAKNVPYARARSDRERDLKMVQTHAALATMYRAFT
jgi:hypothetical protein